MTLRLRIITLCMVTHLIACGGGGGGAPAPTANNTPAIGSLTGQLRRTELAPPESKQATPAFLPSFLAFESGHVRPLAMSEDGAFLYVVNTPDNRLEVYAINGTELIYQQSVAVGMEPVAVAVKQDQVWVVNHLSDSISIISFSESPARVVKTLWVGDEPRDIIFAGANRDRAFVTTAHRGQNHPLDPQLTTPSIGRADVWVFDTGDLGTGLGGSPETILTLFGDTPRALAVSPDGAKVYVAVLNSGNQTTVIRSIPTANKAAPFANTEGVEAPKSAYILKFNGSEWVDENDRDFSARANLSLPDDDVFEIDAMADTPALVRSWRSVGTTLFNMVVNPVNGFVYVSNTDARNHIRFEGEGQTATTVNGHSVDNRITLLRPEANAVIIDLNNHIDRSSSANYATDRLHSLSLPLQMAFNDTAQSLYVAAMGSNKIGVLSVEQLESQTFDPQSNQHIAVTGGGPTGIVIDSQRQQAYVLTRYDNGISVIDTTSNAEVSHTLMQNPEPPSVTQGRPFLYDALISSASGDTSCASCHIFADTDHLAWDLGDPDKAVKPNPFVPVPFTQPLSGEFLNKQPGFHPMKGPKSTQSLRGLPNHGPLHWRGDRTGEEGDISEPRVEAAFKEFSTGYVDLLGRNEALGDNEMQQFTDFAMQLQYPPNPIRSITNVLSVDEFEGRRTYTQVFTSPGGTVGCNTCHVLDVPNGRFGTAADFIAVLGENSQDFKVPHFRNLYQKVGFFRGGANSPQIRGFGLSEPGSTAGIMSLVNSGDFQFENNRQDDQLVSFLLAFDTLLAPIVGQQITLSSAPSAAAAQRVEVMMQRARVAGTVPECDLIVKGVWDGEARGALRLDDDSFQTDKSVEQLTLDQLFEIAELDGNHITFMCAPPNSGRRMGIDRDSDNVLDAD